MISRAEVKQLRDYMEAFAVKLAAQKESHYYDEWRAEEKSDHEMHIMMLRSIAVLLDDKVTNMTLEILNGK